MTDEVKIQLTALGFNSIAEAAAAHDISPQLVHDRVNRKRGKTWNLWEALTTPARPMIKGTTRSEHAHKYRYGLTPADILKYKKDQDNKCFGCLEELGKGFHVEHEHETKEVRGLACPRCNWTLGFLKDNPGNFDAAVEWLTKKRPFDGLAKSNPRAKTKDRWRFDKYGIAGEDFYYLKRIQGNKCGVCKKEFVSDYMTTVDHLHDAGTEIKRESVRGLLCRTCNCGLGKENIETLQRLAKKLIKENG